MINNNNNNNNNKDPLPVLISDVMNRNVITIKEENSLADAVKKIISNNIHRLPVIDENEKLVGLITDRDLRLAANSPFLGKDLLEMIHDLEKHKVKEIMKKSNSLITVEENEPIVEAAKLMRVRNVGGLPVLNKNGNVIGIISRSDLIDHLIRIIEPLTSQNENQS